MRTNLIKFLILKYYKEDFISFAKFAKSYKSSRKVETAYEQWLNKINNGRKLH